MGKSFGSVSVEQYGRRLLKTKRGLQSSRVQSKNCETPERYAVTNPNDFESLTATALKPLTNPTRP